MANIAPIKNEHCANRNQQSANLRKMFQLAAGARPGA
jgi:hypothetical protein